MARQFSHPRVTGLILAGGRSLRMGGNDKSLLLLDGDPLLSHVIRRLAPQCDALVLNANGDPGRFAPFKPCVISDTLPGYLGPLAGILSGLEWTALHRPDIDWIVSVPADTPFIPSNLVMRLHEARLRAGSTLVRAESAGRNHHAIGLWPVKLKTDLCHALEHEHLRSIRQWTEKYDVAEASWADTPIDPFFNVNTPEDLLTARAFLARERPRQDTDGKDNTL
ncbi:molybdenum cofactor guanylyltransferase MobA [Microvirga rosea]|uniref:molybdenum cofactor guanylyltransferase MobA n=1 Tax=Microvirga rosea TaxID=2715425 RepID=UPI001D0A7AF3|nr:molybdenum cofactor guanylyltransferase MobA [Microvirga rosea]MCB8823021.1 molybdenum cofactor guanylyltransferase MobA [Microvirga rosea]